MQRFDSVGGLGNATRRGVASTVRTSMSEENGDYNVQSWQSRDGVNAGVQSQGSNNGAHEGCTDDMESFFNDSG